MLRILEVHSAGRRFLPTIGARDHHGHRVCGMGLSPRFTVGAVAKLVFLRVEVHNPLGGNAVALRAGYGVEVAVNPLATGETPECHRFPIERARKLRFCIAEGILALSTADDDAPSLGLLMPPLRVMIVAAKSVLNLFRFALMDVHRLGAERTAAQFTFPRPALSVRSCVTRAVILARAVSFRRESNLFPARLAYGHSHLWARSR